MAETRFEGSGPVARYWLANCEGFAVRGGVQGTVEALLRDADPWVTTRLVVRRTGRRRTVVPVEAVASVIPAERTVLVERRRSRRATSARTAAGVATRRTAAGTATAAAAVTRTFAAAVPPARSTVTTTWAKVTAGTTRAVTAVVLPLRSGLARTRRHLKPLASVGRHTARYGAAVLLHSFRSLAHEVRGRPTRNP